MANLLATLVSTANVFQAYGNVLETAQNNVANASTPGYAKQSITLWALPFDPQQGVTGGVRIGNLASARDEFSEQAVRRQSGQQGYSQQLVDGLTSLQNNFDISGNQGIPQGLNNLYQAFSAWGANPDSIATRQTVLQRAGDVAQAFQQTANGVAKEMTDTEGRITTTVAQVNRILNQLAGFNHIAMQGARDDAGLSSNIHAALEQLSSLIDVDATIQPDGTAKVLMNGQVPLLLEDHVYAISSGLTQPQTPTPTYPDSPAKMQILGSDGSDVTSKATGGKLGALLELRNTTLSSLLGDSTQAGSLNLMAKQFADRVNTILTTGNISDGPPPVPGVPLFTYDATNDTNVAATLAVDSTVTTAQLAVITPGPPEVSNGIPLALSALASPVQAADKINSVSYTEYYGQIASQIGGALSDATSNQDVESSLLAQAKSIRDKYQGVSLDEEATTLMQFQRAYQAASRFLTVVDQLTETVINILQP